MQYVFYKEGGGWDPLKRKVSGDVNALPAALSSLCTEMANNPNNFKPAKVKASPDANTYHLELTNDHQCNFVYSDLNIPEKILPLIDFLRQKLT